MGVKPDAYEKDIAAPRCLLLLAPLLSSFSILSSNFISPVISYSYSYSYADSGARLFLILICVVDSLY